MKKLILLCFLFLSFHALSMPTDEEISFCQKEGSRYGDGQGRDELPQTCEVTFFKMANSQAIKKSSDHKFIVFGFKNIVFVKDPQVKKGRQNIIAGQYTELKDAIAVAIDEVHKEIAVLEKSGDVLFFSSIITGNVAPLRILRGRELKGSHDLAINPLANEVLVLNNGSREILVFSRLANIHAREGLKKLGLSQSLKNIQGEMLGFNQRNQELLILNVEKDSILVYQMGRSANKFLKAISIGVKNVKRIDYSQKNNEVFAETLNQVFKVPLAKVGEQQTGQGH